jgi:hypothetical protein
MQHWSKSKNLTNYYYYYYYYYFTMVPAKLYSIFVEMFTFFANKECITLWP